MVINHVIRHHFLSSFIPTIPPKVSAEQSSKRICWRRGRSLVRRWLNSSPSFWHKTFAFIAPPLPARCGIQESWMRSPGHNSQRFPKRFSWPLLTGATHGYPGTPMTNKALIRAYYLLTIVVPLIWPYLALISHGGTLHGDRLTGHERSIDRPLSFSRICLRPPWGLRMPETLHFLAAKAAVFLWSRLSMQRDISMFQALDSKTPRNNKTDFHKNRYVFCHFGRMVVNTDPPCNFYFCGVFSSQ